MLLVQSTRPELAFPSGRCEETRRFDRSRVRSYLPVDLPATPLSATAVRTGGFASPSLDGFAKTSARSVRRQTQSTHLYLLRYCCCSGACLIAQQFFDERQHASE